MSANDEQHIQFGEAIDPAKSNLEKRDPDSQYTSVNEKDVEVAFAAQDDFNIKKKQVCNPLCNLVGEWH